MLGIFYNWIVNHVGGRRRKEIGTFYFRSQNECLQVLGKSTSYMARECFWATQDQRDQEASGHRWLSEALLFPYVINLTYSEPPDFSPVAHFLSESLGRNVGRVKSFFWVLYPHKQLKVNILKPKFQGGKILVSFSNHKLIAALFSLSTFQCLPSSLRVKPRFWPMASSFLTSSALIWSLCSSNFTSSVLSQRISTEHRKSAQACLLLILTYSHTLLLLLGFGL